MWTSVASSKDAGVVVVDVVVVPDDEEDEDENEDEDEDEDEWWVGYETGEDGCGWWWWWWRGDQWNNGNGAVMLV